MTKNRPNQNSAQKELITVAGFLPILPLNFDVAIKNKKSNNKSEQET